MYRVPAAQRKRIIFKAGFVGGVFITVTAALFSSAAFALDQDAAAYGLTDTLIGAALFLLSSMVSFGLFGFFVGVVVAGVLSRGKTPLRSVWRLLIRVALLSFVLGCLYPLFDLVLNPHWYEFEWSMLWRSDLQDARTEVISRMMSQWPLSIFSGVASLTCALVCAVPLRRPFLQHGS